MIYRFRLFTRLTGFIQRRRAYATLNRCHIRLTNISATAGGTNRAQEGSPARMSLRISVPEVTRILSGTERLRISAGKPFPFRRSTLTSFHSLTRVVKHRQPGGINSRRRSGVSIGKGVIRNRSRLMPAATNAASARSERSRNVNGLDDARSRLASFDGSDLG